MKNIHTPQKSPNTLAALRAAYGPGFQMNGPTDATLRAITRNNAR
jgi:hypothetical protein